jgi:hypothetical protein
VSLVLGLMPLMAPATAIWPILLLNWTFFIFVAIRTRSPGLISSRRDVETRLFKATLIAFTLSGFVAVLSGSPIA